MVAYVIFIAVLLGLALLVFTYLNYASASIKPPVDCKDGTSVILEKYSCDPINGIINLTIKNNGRFNVDGIIAKFSDNLSKAPVTMLKPNYNLVTPPSSQTTGFFSFASLDPENSKDAKFFAILNDSLEYIASGNTVKIVEIQPYIEEENGKIVCIGTVTKERFTEPDCRIKLTGFFCGDGAINPGEECDGSDLGGQTCNSLGYASGILTCDSNCLFDKTGCSNSVLTSSTTDQLHDINFYNGNVYATGGSYSSMNLSSSTLVINENGALVWSNSFKLNLPKIDIFSGNTESFGISSKGDVYVSGIVEKEFNILDSLLLKYNSSGSLKWNQTFDVWDVDRSMRPLIDNSGNIYVIGHSGISVFDMKDSYIIKYDSNGNKLWNKTYFDQNMSLSAVLDNSGNIYVVGESIKKYDSNGNKIWIKTGMYDVKDISIDTSGNIYTLMSMVTEKRDSTGTILWQDDLGSVYGSGGIVSDSNVNPYIYSSGTFENKFFLIKHDSNRNRVWNKTYDYLGNLWTESSYEIDISDDNSYVYIGGTTSNGTAKDFLIAKVRADNGDLVWFRRWDSVMGLL